VTGVQTCALPILILTCSISILSIVSALCQPFVHDAAIGTVILFIAWGAAVKMRSRMARMARVNEDDSFIIINVFFVLISSMIQLFNYYGIPPGTIFLINFLTSVILSFMIENIYRVNLILTQIFIFFMLEGGLLIKDFYMPVIIPALGLSFYLLFSTALLKLWIGVYDMAFEPSEKDSSIAIAACRTAIDSGNIDLIKEQISIGLSPDLKISGKHLITIAIEKDNEELLIYLIKSGASLWKNDEAEAAIILEWAFQRLRHNTIIILIENGLNPEILLDRNKFVTILMRSAEKNLNLVVEKLIKSGADLEAIDIKEITALGHAILNNSASVMPVIAQKSCIMNISKYNVI